jgi:hypothetical protein
MTQVDPLGAALALLFLAFPSGVTDAIKMTYLSELRRLGITPEVAQEAATRILHTREQRTVPPLAVILKACRQVQGERSNSTAEANWVSAGEARELAIRRLVLQEQPTDERNIEAELGRMEMHDVVRVEA